MCLYNVVSNLVENLLAILAYSEIKFKSLRACLYGGEGLQIGEVTCGGSPHLSCKRDQIKMRDYMDRRVTPPKRITSPTWSPHLHVNRPLICVTNCEIRLVGRHLPKDSPSVFTSVFTNVPMPDSVVDSQARHIKEKLDSKLISERN